MPDQSEQDAIKLLQLLQGCHSILGICWPMPNVSEMAGARIFIGTNPFFALEDAIRLADVEFQSNSSLSTMEAAWETWQQIKAVVSQLSAIGRNSENPMIDPSFNLLYLATGVLYHEISLTHRISPPPVERFSKVEAWEELRRKCNWNLTLDSDSGETTLRAISAELQRCLTALQAPS